MRLIKEGFNSFCDHCDSSLASRLLFFNSDKCINPDCLNYNGN
jgi:hypothetical protein